MDGIRWQDVSIDRTGSRIGLWVRSDSPARGSEGLILDSNTAAIRARFRSGSIVSPIAWSPEGHAAFSVVDPVPAITVLRPDSSSVAALIPLDFSVVTVHWISEARLALVALSNTEGPPAVQADLRVLDTGTGDIKVVTTHRDVCGPVQTVAGGEVWYVRRSAPGTAVHAIGEVSPIWQSSRGRHLDQVWAISESRQLLLMETHPSPVAVLRDALKCPRQLPGLALTVAGRVARPTRVSVVDAESGDRTWVSAPGEVLSAAFGPRETVAVSSRLGRGRYTVTEHSPQDGGEELIVSSTRPQYVVGACTEGWVVCDNDCCYVAAPTGRKVATLFPVAG